MPRAPRKCPKPGCENRITTTPYCPDHTVHGWINGGTTRTNTKEHRAWAAAVLKRDGDRCRLQGPRCIGRATEADHITPVSERGAEFDIENGQAACVPCHRQKSAEEGNRARLRAMGKDLGGGGGEPPPQGPEPPRVGTAHFYPHDWSESDWR